MKVIVDGIEVDVPTGTSALDTIFAAGKDVPYFCANTYLSPVGACRMCLVEAGSPRKGPDGNMIMEGEQPKIFWFPKPMASCTMMATEGMVIKTSSDVVQKAQAGMMEFTLLNHPLDCPTCDKGGACELQDRAYEYGYGESRFEFDRRHADKHHPLSEFIILDQERCIHCKRCVRYFEEVPGQEVLDFIERGSHTFIDTEEGGLPVGFQGNIADICPVGALLDNVARFRGRNWEYDHTPTTCTLCPVGCAITVDARNGRIERILAAENREVNEAWICDAGRFGHPLASDDRLRFPMIRVDGELVETTWDKAIAAINRGVQGVDPADVGLYTSGDITLEEGVALEAVAALLGTPSLDHFPRYAMSVELPVPTLTEVATSDAVVVIGADLGEEAPIVELRILEMLRGGLIPPELPHGTAIADLRLTERPARQREKLAVFASQETRLATQAALASHEAGLDVVAGLASGKGSVAVRDAAALLEKAERPIVIIGADVLNQGSPQLHAQLREIAAKYGARILPLPASSNARGLAHLNLVPRVRGLGYAELGAAKVALISRLDPAAAGQVANAIFTVVHDTHLTETARQADVVLPAVSNYEKRGTTVNLEGRLLPLTQAAVDSGEGVDLIGALNALAEALGLRPVVRGLRSAQKMLGERFGVNVAQLPRTGLIVNLGERHTAPSSLTHVPQLWKPGMRRTALIALPMAQPSPASFAGGDD
ncbi:NADH-quinone oxidoreductase subunit NuoG [Deinococcus peraridilitoris]|uniref:NADH-quinone oxidoreductase subunit NuoG n=1 Tax=Deinococcus peraridilitoris TaxID=432329 RepID=UPI0002D73386|nr:NADH-quinone oxidoreductase subunit NuoG [Deinococcus peraridilitoris]